MSQKGTPVGAWGAEDAGLAVENRLHRASGGGSSESRGALARLRSQNWALRANRMLVYLCLLGVSLLVILPLMWAISASFTPLDKVYEYTSPFSWRALVPIDFTLEAYQNLFSRGFGTALWNSLFLGVTGVVFGGVICAMAGFAFARFDFPGKNLLFVMVILLTFMIPVDLTAVPRFILVRDLGWINTWPGLILPNIVNSIAIFLFRQFFSEIPQDLLDAARVDGANWARVFVGVVVPISRPVLISASLLMFLAQWEQFFWPLLVATRPEMRVIQVEIARSVGQYQTLWNELMAGSVLAALIPILLMLPFQRYYVQVIAGTGLGD